MSYSFPEQIRLNAIHRLLTFSFLALCIHIPARAANKESGNLATPDALQSPPATTLEELAEKIGQIPRKTMRLRDIVRVGGFHPEAIRKASVSFSRPIFFPQRDEEKRHVYIRIEWPSLENPRGFVDLKLVEKSTGSEMSEHLENLANGTEPHRVFRIRWVTVCRYLPGTDMSFFGPSFDTVTIPSRNPE